ncbi:MAG: hypothetical protein SGJ02_14540 [bacterium]|nr:hypothetical protein [bacterium]
MRNQILSAFSLLLIAGCSGNGENEKATLPGTWDVRYNFSTDDCQLVTPGLIGFVQEHTIIEDQGENSFLITSSDSLIVDTPIVENELGIFVSEQSNSGDIFGDGSNCTQATRISYQDLKKTSATTLLSYSIDCGASFFCVSEAIGESTKRNN